MLGISIAPAMTGTNCLSTRPVAGCLAPPSDIRRLLTTTQRIRHSNTTPAKVPKATNAMPSLAPKKIKSRINNKGNMERTRLANPNLRYACSSEVKIAATPLKKTTGTRIKNKNRVNSSLSTSKPVASQGRKRWPNSAKAAVASRRTCTPLNRVAANSWLASSSPPLPRV